MTGADGFLGWHARCALHARVGYEVVPISRTATIDIGSLDKALTGVDAVLHLAGVNRAANDETMNDNVSLARQLTDSLDRTESRPHVVYANSIQAGSPTPFGQTKQAAADHLTNWALRTGAQVSDVHLPNLFGEHGRPNYNSVVATFSHALAHGDNPQIIEDRVVPLLHVQDALDHMLDLIDRDVTGLSKPTGTPFTVSAVLGKLQGFRDLYVTGDIPDLSSRFDRALFNTFRSFWFPDRYPFYPEVRSDSRGGLFECVRSRGGQAQVFCSTTKPGVTRGKHFHLRKVERFLVLRGEATISLRRLFDETIIRFDVVGGRPAIVDMPTMWTHSISNTGTEELTTLFWADEIPNSGSSDTYPEPVELTKETA
ncbi:MAG TPA: NAD-dependent epimerase/dehydratase family protein [Edaphobacter sp.]